VPHKSPSSLLKEAELHRILASNNLDGKDRTTDFSNLVRLAKMDANSCSSVLQELMPLLPMFSDGFKAALVSAMWQIIESVKSDDLTYMAGTTICQILDHGDYAAKSKSDTFEKLKVTSVNISPSVTESTLRLWSKYAGRYLKQLSVSSEQLAAIDQNLTQLRLLLDEDMVGWLENQRFSLTHPGFHDPIERHSRPPKLDRSLKVSKFGRIPSGQVEILLSTVRLLERRRRGDQGDGGERRARLQRPSRKHLPADQFQQSSA
jgi:hypothetical protein